MAWSVGGNMIDEANLGRICKMQNACVRLIDETKTIERIYRDYKILMIDQLIWLENVKIWWKLHNAILPSKLTTNMKLDQYRTSLAKTHKYATRRKSELNIPRAQHKRYIVFSSKASRITSHCLPTSSN